MPFILVDEPYAKPPKLRSVRAGSVWAPPLDVDRGLVELDGVDLRAQPEWADAGCSEVSVVGSTLDGVALGAELTVEIARSALVSCNLSQARISSLRSTRLDGCKLTGTDLAAAAVTDVVFERCTLTYTNLRMAKLTRVQFVDCSLDEVDLHAAEVHDVEFAGSTLNALNVDRMKAARVDLRTASELVLAGVGSLQGCLVAEHQLPALAYSLAMAAGLDIEQVSSEPPPNW